MVHTCQSCPAARRSCFHLLPQGKQAFRLVLWPQRRTGDDGSGGHFFHTCRVGTNSPIGVTGGIFKDYIHAVVSVAGIFREFENSAKRVAGSPYDREGCGGGIGCACRSAECREVAYRRSVVSVSAGRIFGGCPCKGQGTKNWQDDVVILVASQCLLHDWQDTQGGTCRYCQRYLARLLFQPRLQFVVVPKKDQPPLLSLSHGVPSRSFAAHAKLREALPRPNSISDSHKPHPHPEEDAAAAVAKDGQTRAPSSAHPEFIEGRDASCACSSG